MKLKLIFACTVAVFTGVVLSAGVAQAGKKDQKDVLGNKELKWDNVANKAEKTGIIVQNEAHKTGIILDETAGKVETTVLPDKTKY